MLHDKLLKRFLRHTSPASGLWISCFPRPGEVAVRGRRHAARPAGARARHGSAGRSAGPPRQRAPSRLSRGRPME